jgi:hypothetical protein
VRCSERKIVMSSDDPSAKSKNQIGVRRRDLLLSSTSLLAASSLIATGLPRFAKAELTEYRPGTTFPGRMGRTIGESEPAWPAPVRAKSGAPNVLFIVIDDTGFGQLGCYGSPINTPTFDKLASNGLLYTNMHTTALCSPSRSCILTGRNHHSNAMACTTEGSEGYPGANGAIPFENGFLSEILLGQGYNTFALGKWHLTPAEQISAAGPYDRWPLGRGFERYYGFLGGDTSQYYPDLVYDTHQVEPPKAPEQGYHLTPDLVDKAISFISDAKQLAPDKPFFVYFATGAAHAPHHGPREWADKYKGKFDDGWDAYRANVFARQKDLSIIPENTVLSRHDPDVQDWDKLSPDERKLYARMEDPAETNNLADTHRNKLIEMITLWYVEAGKYNVLPLDSRGTARFADERPQLTKERQTYVYYPGTQAVPENVAVKVLNRAHSLTADVAIPKGGAEGVLVCHGGSAGGYSLFIKDNKLHYVHNYVGAQEFHVASDEPVPEGEATLRYEFQPSGKPDIAKGRGTPGHGRLYINGKLVGETELPFTVPLLLSLGAGLSVGRNPGSPVSQLYGPPFTFAGTIFKVTADVSGETLQNAEEERNAAAKRAMSSQ